MQRSKFDIGGADAGAGGMSMTSGSGGASGTRASSSSSDWRVPLFTETFYHWDSLRWDFGFSMFFFHPAA